MQYHCTSALITSRCFAVLSSFVCSHSTCTNAEHTRRSVRQAYSQTNRVFAPTENVLETNRKAYQSSDVRFDALVIGLLLGVGHLLCVWTVLDVIVVSLGLHVHQRTKSANKFVVSCAHVKYEFLSMWNIGAQHVAMSTCMKCKGNPWRKPKRHTHLVWLPLVHAHFRRNLAHHRERPVVLGIPVDVRTPFLHPAAARLAEVDHASCLIEVDSLR